MSVRGRPRKWPGGAVLMSVYLPPDLKEELDTRATIRHMSLSEYTLNLILKGLEIEKTEEAERSAKAEEVH